MDEQQNTKLPFDPSRLSNKDLDNQHSKFQNYLGENIGLQGEVGYAEAKSHYESLNAERAKRMSIALQEQTQKDPSLAQQIDAIGRGFQEKGVDIMGALPDISQAIANRLGIDEGESPFGSKNLSRSLQGLGGGYYSSERLPTADDSKPRILNPITQTILGVQGTSEPTTLGDMPSRLRPYAVGGEELAIGMSFFAPQAISARFAKLAPTPVAMSQGKGFALKQAVNDQVQAFAKNPLAYAGVETGVATLQALGGGVAEKIAPGDENARMIGTLAPVPLVASGGFALTSFLNSITREAVPRATKQATKVARMLLQGDRAIEAELSKELSKYFTKVDMNPSEAIKVLSEAISKQGLVEGKLQGTSVGLLTGNKELLAIESAIINNIPDISQEAAKEAKNAVVTLNNAFDNVLKIEGANPEIVREIADARVAQINALFSTKISNEITKIKNLQEQARLVKSPNAPLAKQSSAVQIRKIIDKNLKQLDDYETSQWNKLDRTLNAQTNETQLAISSLIDEGSTPFVPESLSKLRAVRDIGESIDPVKARGVSSGDLIDAKKELSKRIREAKNANNLPLVRELTIMQNGVYNDLNKISKRFGAQIRIANAATRNKYGFLDIDVVSELLKKSGQGNLPKPDLILEKKLLGGEQLAYNTFNDLLVATRGQILSKENANPLGKFYLAAVDKAIDPNGLVDADKLSKFMIRNQEGLKALGMYDALSEPRNQALFVKKMQEYHKQMNEAPTQKILQNILDTKPSPEKNLSGVERFIDETLFSSTNRKKELFKLTDLIKRKQFHKQDPIQALEGVQYSVLQNLINKSFLKRKYTPYGEEVADLNLISGKNIKDLLEQKQGKTTLEQDLLSTKIFTKEQINSIKLMADKAIELEKNLLIREGIAPSEAVDLLPKGDALAEIMGRLGGVFVAQASPIVSGIGHELVISSIFSKAGKDLMSRLPKDKLRKVLIEATRDPVLMKRLLEDVKTPKAVRSRDQYFLNAMVSKKILSERERYDIEDSAYGVNNIKKLQEDIALLGKKGLSANRIMAVYELAARNKNQNVGEFVLDQVQSILDMSDEERTKIRMRIPKRPIRKRITRPNLQPTNP